MQMGLQGYLIADALSIAIGQRLIRKLCRHCRVPYQATAQDCTVLGVSPDKPPVIYRSMGCDHCEYQGYRGRFAIMEILKIDGDLDEMIAGTATTREILKAAIARGFRTLADDGVRRIIDGSSSLDELFRVIDMTDRIS